MCFLRAPRDLIFRNRLEHHLLLGETIAAVPGMVGGALLHFSCLRRIRDDEGWIQTMLEEAKTERQHLLSLHALIRPNLFDKIIIFSMQFTFVLLFFLLYVFGRKSAHRFVGYLEEDAIEVYEQYLLVLKQQPKKNVPAPEIAYQYWEFSGKVKLDAMIKAIIKDEKRHRDTNHEYADKLAH